jgi:hypothetical protein
MGYYINPLDMSKEEWLQKNATRIGAKAPISHNNPDTGEVALVWVDNGGFTAVAIAFDDYELAAFNQPSDWRPKQWFWVSRDKIEEFMN